jgi:Short C-terminal domain
VAKAAKFRIANYAGGLPSHPDPKKAGNLILTPAFKWELHLVGARQWVVGGIGRFAFDVESTGPKSCRVVLRDQQDETIRTSFDLPDTPADKFEAALASQQGRLEGAMKRDVLVSGGQWWLAPGTFKCLGFTERFTVSGTAYHGGWSGHPKTHGNTNLLEVDKRGIGLRGMKTIFTIPWEQIVDVTVDGPETAATRITATRLLAFGVFALAAKKKTKAAIVIVTTANGDQAVFQTEKSMPHEVSPKLIPLAAHVRKAAQQRDPASPTASLPSPPTGVADEIAKLAQLREAGVLTDEEFAAQKAKLLNN